MPVYEYQCTTCGEKFEVMQRISDAPISVCRSCGGGVRKLITNTSFVLKGSGWYVTDYPSADRKKAIEATKPSDASAKKDEKKSADKTVSEKKTVNVQ